MNGEVYLCDEDFICENVYVNEICAIEKEERDEQDGEYVPCTVMQVQYVQGKEMEKPMMILFDPGSTRSYVKQQILPAGATPRLHREELLATTLSGESRTNRSVELRNIIFPEFTRSLRLEKCEMWVFDSASVRYDAIIGRDLLQELKMDICYSDNTMKMEGRRVLMKMKGERPSFYIDNDHSDEELDEMYAGEIKEAKYEKVGLDEVIEQQKHLNLSQKMQLRAVFKGFETLFDGKLKKYLGKKIHLELKDDAKPVHCKPFPVPQKHADVFKKECKRLCDEDVLEPVGATEHAYPTFIIPKKDGTVRWVSDFRKLNANLRRRVYPLPRIQDVLHRRPNYQYFTKIDLSMCYYTFELDEKSKNTCVVVTPFGKFRYKRLPMGVSQAPDLCQEIMESILKDIPDVEVFLDDIGIFSQDYLSHMKTIATVLTRLQSNGFTVNPLKCEWAVKETDWLGYWLTPTGLRPWSKKIQAIQRIQPPTTIKQLRSFIGAVNYYRDMWPKRAHLLSELTALTGKTKFEWTDVHQKAFERMKAVLATDCLLRYPDHNKPFQIYTDASDFQMGAVIMQENQPVAYFSRKLNPAQRNYSTIEKELLSIVEVLREFRTMLYGCDLTIFTDHKNLTYANLNTQRVLRWRVFIEEYGPKFSYVKGQDNIIADFFSRTPLSEGKEAPGPYGPTHTSDTTKEMWFMESEELNIADYCYSTALDDRVFRECFSSEIGIDAYVNVEPEGEWNPINYGMLMREQRRQEALWRLPEVDPRRYSYQRFGESELVCYQPLGAPNFAIMIPENKVNATISWFHEKLNHAGRDSLISTMSRILYHPQLRERIENYVKNCETCQKHKLQGRGYGHMAPREALVAPWYEIAIDTIGPWEIELQNNETRKFHALTMIDTVTNLVEMQRVNTTSALDAANAFEMNWLFKYPRPVRVIHDQGTEFMGDNFQSLLRRWGIRNAPISVRNPQANAVCERMHQTVGNILRTLIHTNPPQDVRNAEHVIDYALQMSVYALRTTVRRTAGVSSGAIVFHRDMFMDLPFVADLLLLRNKRQALIDYNLRRENLKRRNFDYEPGMEVLELTPNPNKLGKLTRGPFTIERVHCNGTITIRRNANVVDRINIRNVRPFRRAEGNHEQV